MTQVGTNLHFPPRLNLEKIRAPPPIIQTQKLSPHHAKLGIENLPFQTKSTPRTGPTSTQEDVLDLNAIMDNYNFETKKTEHVVLEKSAPLNLDFEEALKNDSVGNDNDNYDTERVIKKPTDIFNDSDLLGSSNLSSYIIENNKMSQDQDFFQQQSCDLQTMINQAAPYSAIQLPNSTIVKVKKLIINKPLILQGASGSTLEVSDSIVINLNGYNHEERNRVIISECTIFFEYKIHKESANQSTASKIISSKISEDFRFTNKKSYAGQIDLKNIIINSPSKNETLQATDTRIYPLFRISSPCGVLEVRDSNISSRNKALNIHDICFYLDSQNQQIENSPSVYVQSTSIYGFSTAFQNNMMGKLYLEKLFIKNTHNHALNISNPYVLEMKECTIEDTSKSCVNLRFSLELTIDQRKILIEKNKFSKGQSYGISIFGENMKSQLCDINISENIISHFEKDGIGIKNLNISQIRIEKNQILHSSRNGISIQNVFDLISFHQVHLIQNKISQSHLYGLMLTDVSCFSEKDEISQNGKTGVLVKGSTKPLTKEEVAFSKKCPLRIIFSFANIYYNKESGVTVYGYLKGPMILTCCRIHENSNGIYLKQEDGGGDKTVENDIVIDKCAIFQNELSGLYVKKIGMKVYLKETIIYENRNYAIFIQNEEEKDQVIFQDGRKKARKNIAGYVGGSWGVMFEENHNVCKRVTCNIF